MANKNDVIIIELDKPRELRYGHKALKKLSAKTGMSMESMSEGEIDFDEIETIIFYGLEADDKKNHGGLLTIEQMEDVLDEAESVKYYMEKMYAAFGAAFGSDYSQAQAGNGATAGK